MSIVDTKLDDLTEGMIIAQDVLSNGVLLISKGTRLNSSLILRLKHDIYNHNNRSVSVYVNDNSKDKKNNNNLKFDDDVKERVLTSVDYIFTSEDNDKVTEAATLVSEMIVDEITSNTFSAVCLEELKLCDNYTFNHCIDVASMGIMLARDLKFSGELLKEIGTAGVLHDVGKKDVPLEIINKNGKLTDEEFNIMKQHPIYSYNRIKGTDLSENIKLGVLQHHEKYCGGGYPLGLVGKDINIVARVLSVVDVYAALVTKRAYKKAFRQSECIETMYGMYQQFDIDIFMRFLKVLVVYPNGSIVHLSNKEDAKVISQNRGYPLRPTVKLKNGKVVNLSTDLDCTSIIIL